MLEMRGSEATLEYLATGCVLKQARLGSQGSELTWEEDLATDSRLYQCRLVLNCT